MSYKSVTTKEKIKKIEAINCITIFMGARIGSKIVGIVNREGHKQLLLQVDLGGGELITVARKDVILTKDTNETLKERTLY